MTVTELFLQLPPRIDYAGFTFVLSFTEHRNYGIGIGYILLNCHSKKKYKRDAFRGGYWEDRAVNRQISTMFSNYLFFEPLFDATDSVLKEALQSMQQKLVGVGLITPEVYRKDKDTDLLICAPIKLLEA
jgi:hypothetical protein